MRRSTGITEEKVMWRSWRHLLHKRMWKTEEHIISYAEYKEGHGRAVEEPLKRDLKRPSEGMLGYIKPACGRCQANLLLMLAVGKCAPRHSIRVQLLHAEAATPRQCRAKHAEENVLE
ncbi:hypothetical protein, conserved [Leishmania tarentolae]|uniref:Uncharacterized protein n=1 Tax=Leishmania tarentolae TaxID=5689 RepID=A0A640KAH5_LEITA|nr:hypothetical protein, conserved [Leishmania tarentolae]